ncbi:MAG TPA: STAS domain-containing protein [Actinoplanes sp.]|nr:STAS domain-containing protein [Actinoplanes sp.]
MDHEFSAVGEVDGDLVTVTVTGEVDMATAADMFRAATPGPAHTAVLDLRAVTFFDSAAIHALVRLADHYPGSLKVHPSDRVRRVLDISGLGGQPWIKPG